MQRVFPDRNGSLGELMEATRLSRTFIHIGWYRHMSERLERGSSRGDLACQSRDEEHSHVFSFYPHLSFKAVKHGHD